MKMRFVTYTLFFMWPFISWGQQRYNRSAGEKAFAEMRYADAIYFYGEVIKKDTADEITISHLAESYYKTQQYSPALKWYAKAVDMQPVDTLSLYRYGQLLAMHARYTEAAGIYRKYFALTGGHHQHLLQTATLYEQGIGGLYKDTAQKKVSLLNINSGYADFSPVFHRSGLLFISDRPRTKPFKTTFGWNGGSFLTIYQVTDTSLVKDAGLNTPALRARLKYDAGDRKNNDNNRSSSGDSKVVGANPQFNFATVPNQLSSQQVAPYDSRLNYKYHTGPVALNKRQDTLFLTRNNIYKQGKSEISRLQLEILVARHDTWELQHDFPYNSADYSIGQPAPHPDGHVLFFTSDMPGGYGGKDIYYSIRTDSGWSTPNNAGPFVNTAGDEMFPYVAPSGQLYFSSDTWPGLGGLDIFSVSLDASYHATAAPVNAGAPINSPRNDFGILLYENGVAGFISSDREGNDNIFRFGR